jgi:probable F420-dependent oxidoreductase
MQIGASLGMDWLADIAGVRQAAIDLDGAGFDYLTTAGHLLTAPLGRYPERPPAVYSVPYRDPFVLFSHLAAVTSHISFRTAVLILPMFPTALVAKQAADLSLLSGGRFQLGVGISWQEAEYLALGQQLRARGRRLEEQIEVLRLLWREPVVTFKGRFHDIDGIGIGQLPEHPIGIWTGSGAEPRLLRRAAELADGWMPAAGVRSAEAVRMLQAFAHDAGKAGGVAVTGRVTAEPDVEAVVADARSQVEAGATELTVSPPASADIAAGVAAVIAARARIADALG